MSYLALPRIGFQSTSAYLNPSTANNGDLVDFLDLANVQLRNPPRFDPPNPDLARMDLSAYRDWMMSLVTLRYPDWLVPPEPNGVPRYGVESPGYWNYYGDHLLTFGDATVTSLWLDGATPRTSGADPLLGARVDLHAVLVDLNPADTYSSQVIGGMFKVSGRTGDGGPVDWVTGLGPTVATTRWLNYQRPYGAGTFQFVVPGDRVTFDRSGTSPALQVLAEAVAQGAGLLVRFCIYCPQLPTYDFKQLYGAYQQGQYVANPMRACVLGSLGAWNGQDLASAPVGRLLYTPGSPFHAADPVEPRQPLLVKHGDVDRFWGQTAQQPVAQSGPTPAADPPLPGLGPAVAVVDPARQVIMLDLLTTFPEVSLTDRTKQEAGQVSLALAYTDGQGQPQTVLLGAVAYDQATYEGQAGVVEVSYAAHPEVVPWLEPGQFFLRSSLSDTPILEEIETAQIETDEHCVYLQQGVAQTIALCAFVKGVPATEPTVVQLEQWRDQSRPGWVEGSNPLVVGLRSLCFERVTDVTHADELAVPAMVTIPAGGVGALPLTPGVPGCYKIRCLPPGSRPHLVAVPGCGDHAAPDFRCEFFLNIRVLPADDYSSVPDAEINSWEFMMEHVFGYYVVVYPIMLTIIPWGAGHGPQDQARVREFAALIRQAVDESRLDSPLYMPITRDLSAGKRRLLQRWCDLQLQATPPE